MKKICLICVVLFATASMAHAQRFSLGNRLPLEYDDNYFEGTGVDMDVGAVFGQDSTLYGVSASYPYARELLLSAGIAFVDFDEGDADGPTVYGSAAYAVSFGLPFQTAVLTKLAYAQLEGDAEGRNLDADIYEFSLLAEASGPTSLADLEWNFRAGFAYADSSDDIGPDGEINPQVGAGVDYSVSQTMRLWAAVDHVDDTYVSAGLRRLF